MNKSVTSVSVSNVDMFACTQTQSTFKTSITNMFFSVYKLESDSGFSALIGNGPNLDPVTI